MKKLLLVLSIFLFGVVLCYGVDPLSVVAIDGNSVKLQWGAITNATAYSVSYSAQVKIINNGEIRTVGNDLTYVLSGLQSDSIYVINIIPVFQGITTTATNNVTITTRAIDVTYVENYGMDKSVKGFAYNNVSASALPSAGNTLCSYTLSNGDWYINNISSTSSVSGIIGVYINNVLVDILGNPAGQTYNSDYNALPKHITNTSTIALRMISGTSGTYYGVMNYTIKSNIGK
jgi:hypothetical protein